jgi:hypothetical protein
MAPVEKVRLGQASNLVSMASFQPRRLMCIWCRKSRPYRSNFGGCARHNVGLDETS